MEHDIIIICIFEPLMLHEVIKTN